MFHQLGIPISAPEDGRVLSPPIGLMPLQLNIFSKLLRSCCKAHGDVMGSQREREIGTMAIHDPKPYEFIGTMAIPGPKPYEFIWKIAIHGPEPCKFTRDMRMDSPKP